MSDGPKKAADTLLPAGWPRRRDPLDDPLPYGRARSAPGNPVSPFGMPDVAPPPAGTPSHRFEGVADALGLSDATLTLLRDLIHEQTGVFFEAKRLDLLSDKLSARVVALGFSSFLDYYYLLKYDAGAATEWLHVTDALAVPETYFWREVDQIRALAEHVVPAHFARTQAPLRIWSAACCTGEEPLSILMMLSELGWLQRAPIEVLGSDASPAAIARARSGLYRERAFRALPLALREKYFRREGETWRIEPAIHARVKLFVANLLDPETARDAAAHVIFCRNVFIYFSPSTIHRAVHNFYQSLASPGHLFVGAVESLIKHSDEFELQETGGAFIYVKR